MGALLETVHLKKYFKTSSGLLHAVDDVSISIDEGKTLALSASRAVASPPWAE